jgi:uncharacterized protein (TIGR02266 family)
MSADVRERRLHPRKSFRTRVIFEDEFGDGLFYVWSEDFSQGGIFLASAVPMRVGTLLYLSFVLPGHKRPVRVTGEVVRIAGEKGMGIRFAGLSDLAKKRLEEFLS